MRKILISAILCFVFFTGISSASASEMYDQAVSDYDYQINNYRTVYDEFLLKREQFEKIDSFANQEELVVAVRQMLVARATVWHVYWQALITLATETPGMDIKVKEELLDELEDHQQELEAHQVRIGGMDDLDDLRRESSWLDKYDKIYNSLAYKVLLQIRLARYHWALAQLESFAPILEKNVHVQVRDPEIKEVKLRGLEEVQELLEKNRESLTEVVDDSSKKEARNYETVYEKAVKELAKSYSELVRSYKVIVELSAGTEL